MFLAFKKKYFDSKVDLSKFCILRSKNVLASSRGICKICMQNSPKCFITSWCVHVNNTYRNVENCAVSQKMLKYCNKCSNEQSEIM